MKLETERLFLQEMTSDDFDALYAVLADSDIMQHYPYAFDEARVRSGSIRTENVIVYLDLACGRSGSYQERFS